MEVEGRSEENVKVFFEKVGFDYIDAGFSSVIPIYTEKYNLNKIQV